MAMVAIYGHHPEAGRALLLADRLSAVRPGIDDDDDEFLDGAVADKLTDEPARPAPGRLEGPQPDVVGEPPVHQVQVGQVLVVSVHGAVTRPVVAPSVRVVVQEALLVV